MTLTRRSLMCGGVAALVALSAGCAQNAILELQVELPPAPPGETIYASVQVRVSDDHSFRFMWDNNGDPSSVLLTEASQWDCISVQSTDPTVSLHVRVRFCGTPDCLAFTEEPERLYRLETPFYIRARTFYQIRIPQVPTCTETEDTCGAWGRCVDARCACSTDSECGDGFACAPTDPPGQPSHCFEAVSRCAIEGCIDGTVAADFCTMEGGELVHFCDVNPDHLRAATFMCAIPDGT